MGAYAAYWAIAAVGAGTAVDQHNQARRANQLAEEQAAQQRASLAALAGEKEPVIPLANDDAARRSRRRSIAGMRRRGRSSTILTGDGGTGDTLGAS